MMANMSYCRFENTFRDLEDCVENIDNDGLSESEKKYKAKLIALCIEVSIDHPYDEEDEDEPGKGE